MKGTIGSFVGQDSGFIIYQKSCALSNWSLDLEDYIADLRRTVKVKNCLIWLISAGYMDFDGDEAMKMYREDTNPVTLEDLMVEGVLYDFGSVVILAPKGWN
jgi:hypothetical protein